LYIFVEFRCVYPLYNFVSCRLAAYFILLLKKINLTWLDLQRVADNTGLMVYLFLFSCCWVRNLRNPAKFSEIANVYSSRSSKVIDIGVNRKRICNFILVINSNFGRISYSFYALQRICYRPSVCLSVRLSVTRVYHRKTVEFRIKKFSPYGCPIPLVFVG